MKAILFDLDGTLIDSSEGITKSAQYALSHFGIDEPDRNSLFFFIGPPLINTFMEHYGFTKERALEAVKKYRERYNKIGIFECSLFPGAKECIEALKAAGYRIGLASSKPEKSCERILEHFGILDMFDEVVGATFDGRIDTKEEVLNEVMRRWSDIPRDEMCLIGDTMFDIEGANRVDVPSIAVSFGFGDVNEMVSAGAKVIGSFTIGENSKIGAGSVVLEEVPPNCTVVGVPGRIVKRENRKVPRSDMDQIHLPDPVLEDIRTLQKENEALKSKLQRMEYQLQEIREEKEKNEL